MRHGKRFNHLSRTSAHRKAMLANMASSLIIHKRIKTTLAKAKALKIYVEPLLTKSKEDSTHSRRVVFSYLQDKEAVNELFREISVKIADRPGGYTRILKLGTRQGDNAEMCLIELVDYNEVMLAEKPLKAKKTRRSRRGGSKPVDETTATVDTETKESTDEVKEDTVLEDKVEATEEVKEEPKPEAKVEVKAEVKEEPKAEVIEEPKTEAKEEPKTEVKEEPKAEVKEEEKKEEPKAEAKEEKKEEEKPSEEDEKKDK